MKIKSIATRLSFYFVRPIKPNGCARKNLFIAFFIDLFKLNFKYMYLFTIFRIIFAPNYIYTIPVIWSTYYMFIIGLLRGLTAFAFG